jgi:heme-degrading monooxygenase HmoA
MAQPEADGPIVTVFRSRLRADPVGYEETAMRMYELGTSMPGFLEFKQFTADDGERLALVMFDSREHQRAWREHPEHQEAQRRGRQEWYAEYRIQVCQVLSEHGVRG